MCLRDNELLPGHAERQWRTAEYRQTPPRIQPGDRNPFARYDVLLTPVSPVLAFAHMQQPVRKRKLIVNGEP